MTFAEQFGRLLLLTGSVAALGLAAGRVAGRATEALDLRVIGAVALGCFAAISEALLLGLVGRGENGLALTAGALLTAAVVLRAVRPAPGPTITGQVRALLPRLSVFGAVSSGAALGGGAVTLGVLLHRPFSPYDALQYHLAWPEIWLHNGHPGSLVAVNSQVPVQGYPKNTEVLLGWLVGLSHTAAVGTLMMFALMALAAVAMVAALVRCGVDRRWAALGTAAVLLVPVSVLQLPGPSNDLAALFWIVVTGALCLGSYREPGLLPVAFVAGGLALGTKATTAPPVLVMLAVAIIALRARLRSHHRSLLAGAGLGTAIGALWYVQDWVHYGAPLFPFYRFPSGPPVPITISAFGTSFLHSARASVRVGTVNGYFTWFGGGLVVLGGVVVAALLLPALRRSERRWMLLALAAALVEAAIWSNGPFTGYPGLPYTTYFPLDGVRYLLSGLPVIVLPLLLLTRTPKVRWVAVAVLAAAVAGDLWAWHRWALGYRPRMAELAAGALAGALLGALVIASRRGWSSRPAGGARPPIRTASSAPRPLAARLVGVPLVVVLGAAALSLPAHGWLARAVANPQPGETSPLSIPIVVGWLEHQPSWEGGDQDVAAGPIVDALLAGPAMRHRLSVVSQDLSCADVRALATTDWLVLQGPVVNHTKDFTYLTFTRSQCLSERPAFAGGGYLVYRPGTGDLTEAGGESGPGR